MSLSNSQYNAIMRIYNQRQFQNKYEQDQRVMIRILRYTIRTIRKP